VAEWLKAAVC